MLSGAHSISCLLAYVAIFDVEGIRTVEMTGSVRNAWMRGATQKLTRLSNRWKTKCPMPNLHFQRLRRLQQTCGCFSCFSQRQFANTWKNRSSKWFTTFEQRHETSTSCHKRLHNPTPVKFIRDASLFERENWWSNRNYSRGQKSYTMSMPQGFAVIELKQRGVSSGKWSTKACQARSWSTLQGHGEQIRGSVLQFPSRRLQLCVASFDLLDMFKYPKPTSEARHSEYGLAALHRCLLPWGVVQGFFDGHPFVRAAPG